MTISPPIAATRPHSFTAHGVTIEDPWAWLKDANYPDVSDKDVLAYLEAENAYFEQAMAPHRPLVDRLTFQPPQFCVELSLFINDRL